MGYLSGFLLLCFSLAGWYFKRGKFVQRLFWSALFAYGIGLGTLGMSWMFAVQTIARDFLFVSAFGGLFAWAAGWKKSGLAAVSIALAGLFFYVRLVLWPFALTPAIALDTRGELLLELKEGKSLREIVPVLRGYGLSATPAFSPESPESTALDNWYTVDIPSRFPAEYRFLEKWLSRHPAVAWVEGNEQVLSEPLELGPSGEDNNPARYGLDDPGVSRLWSFDRLKMDELYEVLASMQGQPVRKALVAILDTGVDAGHEDLKSNFRSLKASWDTDPKGHGTHCAGIAAAVSNNGRGVASFSRDNRFVQVTSVKVLGAGGMGSQKTIIDGMLYAADHGADVISLSLGGPGTSSSQRAYRQATEYTRKKGVIVVAAAGNSNRNATNFAPANTPGILCVSAVDAQLQRADFSNTVGDIAMAVAAPGVDIYSTIPAGSYASYSGTSMATPYVAGLAALCKSIRPALTTSEFYKILDTYGLSTRQTKETGKFIQPAASVRALLRERR